MKKKIASRKTEYFTKKFILLIALVVINSLSGFLAHGQNNQTPTTVLQGMWVHAGDFNNRTNTSISSIRILIFQDSSYLDTTILIAKARDFIAVNKNEPASGTFRVDVPNNKLILTDPFGASFSLQYILRIVPAGEGRTYLQLKTADGSILTYYAYTPAAVFNSKAELRSANLNAAYDDFERSSSGRSGFTSDPEFQRAYEEANQRNPPGTIPPNLVLPSGETVEELTRPGTNNSGGIDK